MSSRILLALAAGTLLLFTTGCDKLKSRDHLNQGVAAYKSAKYNDAVEHFKQALALDPDSPNARVYLATAYMVQWIPGADSPENNEFAKKAKEEFINVLNKDQNDKTALAYLASLAFNQASSLTGDKKIEKFDEAASWNHKLIAIDPKSKEAYYNLGVISWAKWHPGLMQARANLRMKPEDPGPLADKKVKEQLRAQYSGILEEGVQSLKKAIEIDKDYDDAMAYINLLIRERADLLDSKEEYNKQVAEADGYLQRALDAKKAKAQAAEKAAQSGAINREK
jgi:tetratricopeptide (TPR) repeat protein